MFLRVLSCLAGLLAINGQDVVGSRGCNATACVFSNANLRFGTGLQTSVNEWGLFVQPWYYSYIANSWYKLTFNNYPLDTAIGLGTSGPNWSGTTVVDLYSLTSVNRITDYSDFVVSSSDATKSVGYGKIVSYRTFTILGQQVTVKNTFSLGVNDSFVKIITSVTNNHTSTVNNVLIWVGTRDDYVGMTDVNTKTRGNLNTGSFVAVTQNNQSSRAIMITNPTEGVLFYSETPDVMTSYALCCSFANVYNTYPLSLPPATASPTDGSYAAVLPLGNITSGASSSITWYYAAGVISSLSTVATTVVAAQQADVQATSVSQTVMSTGTPTGTTTSSVSATPTATPTSTISTTATASPTASTTPSMSATPTASSTSSMSGTATATPSTSSTATKSPSPTASSTSTLSETNTPTASSTTTGTSSTTISVSNTPSSTSTPTTSSTNTLSATSTPTVSAYPTLNPPIYVHEIVYVNTTVTSKTEVDSRIFLYIFLPLNILLCCCCIGVLVCRKLRTTEKKPEEAKPAITVRQVWA